MYAVIVSGGKQHKVKEGDIVKLEKIEQGIGETVVFNEVLLIANGSDLQLGAPLVEGGKVSGEIVSQTRGDKINIIKFRRRKHHMKHMGHRQYYTSVKITGIGANAKEATAASAKAEKPAAKKASPKKTASKAKAEE
ncbi:MAG: rplU [Gammaproteobacteria bacterium]|jgi:large subunit ribosomal protein L21|nr:rplU [Gammaproteobacteria bacterium]